MIAKCLHRITKLRCENCFWKIKLLKCSKTLVLFCVDVKITITWRVVKRLRCRVWKGLILRACFFARFWREIFQYENIWCIWMMIDYPFEKVLCFWHIFRQTEYSHLSHTGAQKLQSSEKLVQDFWENIILLAGCWKRFPQPARSTSKQKYIGNDSL